MKAEWCTAFMNFCCASTRFELENELRLEHNQRCLFASNTAMQWLDIRLQMIGVAVITAIAGIAIIQHQKQIGNPGRLSGFFFASLRLWSRDSSQPRVACLCMPE